MAEPDGRGNETLASDGSCCLSGNFKPTNNSVCNCGSSEPPEGSRPRCAPLPHAALLPSAGSPCPLQAPPAPCRPPCPLQAPPAPSSPPAPCRPPCPLQSGPLSSCLWERGPAIPRGPSHSQTEKLSPVRQSEWLKVTQQRAGGPGRPLSFALPQTHGLSEDVRERQAPSRNGTDSLSPSGARSQGCI